MEKFTIKVHQEADGQPCALCGEPTARGGAAGLFIEDRVESVCRACGKRHAPHLVALIDLAQVAEKVGRTCRHALVPPMEALLALARAAEDYAQARPSVARRAA